MKPIVTLTVCSQSPLDLRTVVTSDGKTPMTMNGTAITDEYTSMPRMPMKRVWASEDAEAARISPAIGTVQVNVTTLNRVPRMNEPPAPWRCLFVRLPTSQDGRLMSYRPNRENANQRKRRPTTMLTHMFVAKTRAPSGPRASEKAIPIVVKETIRQIT